jgi:hypothetical protein
MEHEGSLPHSKQPATCTYPEQDGSSPYTHTTSQTATLILSSLLRLGHPSGSSSPHQKPVRNCAAPVRAICSPPFIYLDFITQITLGEEYRS